MVGAKEKLRTGRPAPSPPSSRASPRDRGLSFMGEAAPGREAMGTSPSKAVGFFPWAPAVNHCSSLDSQLGALKGSARARRTNMSRQREGKKAGARRKIPPPPAAVGVTVRWGRGREQKEAGYRPQPGLPADTTATRLGRGSPRGWVSEPSPCSSSEQAETAVLLLGTRAGERAGVSAQLWHRSFQDGSHGFQETKHEAWP